MKQGQESMEIFMKIGNKKNINSDIIKYYELNYDLVRTPDFDEKSRLLKPENGVHAIGYSKNKTCRFCGKGEDEVSFKKIAHAFPESIGNKSLLSNYECDICNQYFGNTIENDYSKFFSFYHSIMQIRGKNGIPKCSFKIPCSKRTDKCAKNCIDVSFNPKENIPYIRACKEVDSQFIKLANNSIIISKTVDNYCPIAVFKAIVKMAITVMPFEEISLFSNAIKWLLDKEHKNFYIDKKLLVRYKMIPGFNVIKYPRYALYRRKTTIFDKPYMLFNLTYGCFSLLVEIPRNNYSIPDSKFLDSPFPPIPFYTLTEGLWDLSEKESPKDFRHSIKLCFDYMTECTDDVQIIQENGKSKIELKPKLK